jgi:hypothetical protein
MAEQDRSTADVIEAHLAPPPQMQSAAAR